MAHFHPLIVIGCLNDRNTNNTNKFLKGKTLLFISIFYISNVGQVNNCLLPTSFIQSIHVLILFSVCKDTFHYSKVRFRDSLTKEGCGGSLCIKEANSTSCVILLLLYGNIRRLDPNEHSRLWTCIFTMCLSKLQVQDIQMTWYKTPEGWFFIHRMNFKSWGFLPRVSLVFKNWLPCVFTASWCLSQSQEQGAPLSYAQNGSVKKRRNVYPSVKIKLAYSFMFSHPLPSLILGSVLLTVTRLWYRTEAPTHAHTSVSTLGIPHCCPVSFSFLAVVSIPLNMALQMLELSCDILAKMCTLYPNPNLNIVAAQAHHYLWITYNNFKLFFKNKMLAETY